MLKRQLYTQLLFTAFAFLLMVVLSHFFVYRIVLDDIARSTEIVFNHVQIQINSDLTKTQAALGGFAQTVRSMILNGEGADKIINYTVEISDFLRSSENNGLTISGLYGYIEKYPDGPVFINGFDMAAPDGYSPENRPWYTAAIELGGDIAETPPYHDIITNENILTYSCAIYDDKGVRLGVVCVDVLIDQIGKTVVGTALTKDGYGFLLAHDMTVLAHPEQKFIGIKLPNKDIPLSDLVNEIKEKGEVSGVDLKNWKGEDTIAFVKKLPNGWYVGLLALKKLYYGKVRTMALTLSALGFALATVLIMVLIRLDAARNKSDMDSRHKSAFLANMSHEIRTPMNAIIGMTTLGKSASDIERKDYCFMKIEDASNHLLGVINDILDMSKIEANKFELSPVEFDFEKMLERVVNVLNFRVDQKQQNFSVHIDSSIPHTLIGDEQRLAQVITNLLWNAVKFTPEKGSINLTVRLAEEEDGLCTLQISVNDTGIGISAEQQARLFRSFEQAESSTTRKYGGTGLGLAISKSIVEMMGGTISVQSEPGKGSTFIVTIKVKRGTNRKQGLLSANLNLNNIRIMAVDDDPDILLYFRDITQRFGVYCDTAISSKEALALLEKNGAYDIYFVDWKMPDMDGIQLARELKKHPSENSVVIMISAAEWSSIAQEAKNAGIEKFLSKPLLPSTIANAINESLNIDKQKSDKTLPDITGIFAGRRILLAEDVDINREILQTLLEPTQLEIYCAENGQEAVRMFSEAPDKYELIFMDVQMPKMDGYEATKRIRALDIQAAKEIPIIAMTANVFKEDIERCLMSGMNSHVGKPLNIEEVLEKLRSYLDQK